MAPAIALAGFHVVLATWAALRLKAFHPIQLWATPWAIATSLFALHLLPYRTIGAGTCILVVASTSALAIGTLLGERRSTASIEGRDRGDLVARERSHLEARRAALLALALLATMLLAFIAQLTWTFGLHDALITSPQVRLALKSGTAAFGLKFVYLTLAAAGLAAVVVATASDRRTVVRWSAIAVAVAVSAYFSTGRSNIVLPLVVAGVSLGVLLLDRLSFRFAVSLLIGGSLVVFTIFTVGGAIIGKTFDENTLSTVQSTFVEHPSLQPLALPYEYATAPIAALDRQRAVLGDVVPAYGCATLSALCKAGKLVGLPTEPVVRIRPFTKAPLPWNTYTALDLPLLDAGVLGPPLWMFGYGLAAGWLWRRARARKTAFVVLYGIVGSTLLYSPVQNNFFAPHILGAEILVVLILGASAWWQRCRRGATYDSWARILARFRWHPRPAVPKAPSQQASHRPALDGVRAIAVLAVIAYHLGSHVPGGFLGVDVFFVLSGYLITRLLLTERRATGRINLANFWARRARRLLPAVLLLVVVVAVVTRQSEPLLTFAARRDDMLSTIFYYANWHFIATDQSYFAAVLGQSPLGHTWSLAIEEQFYLVWPVALLAITYLCRDRLWRLLGVALVGVIGSVLWMALAYDATAPTRVYFATGTRAHELLIGAGLAMLIVGSRQAIISDRGFGRVLMWTWPLVALSVAVAFLTVGDQDGFYYRGGSLAFALVIALGLWIVEVAPRSIPARLLSFRPVAWIGTISYGLYLWHWPMIQWVGGSDRFSDPHVRKVAEIVLTFAVATASYYAVERPIRTGRIRWLRFSVRRLAIAAPLTMAIAVLVVFSATTVPESVKIATRLQATLARSACPAGSPAPVRNYVWCTRTARTSSKTPTVATFGDSTVQALQPGMQRFAEQHGWGYVQAGKNRCTILPLVFPSSAADSSAVAFARGCIPGMQRLLESVRQARHPDVWIISDRWMLLPLLAADGAVVNPLEPRHDALVFSALKRRLADLTRDGEKAVIVVMPPLGPPAECAGRPPSEAACTSSRYTMQDEGTARARQILKRAARASNGSVAAVDIDDVICPGGTCPATIGGKLVRYDGIHFTEEFSRRIVPYIVSRAEKAGIQFAHDG